MGESRTMVDLAACEQSPSRVSNSTRNSMASLHEVLGALTDKKYKFVPYRNKSRDCFKTFWVVPLEQQPLQLVGLHIHGILAFASRARKVVNFPMAHQISSKALDLSEAEFLRQYGWDRS